MGKVKPVLFEDMEHCYVCGSNHVHWHHIFYGTANRKISDRLGYVAPLCGMHHNMSNDGVHFNKAFDLHLKRMAQEHFERNNGTRDDFIKLIGRNYL